jgi:4-hydroxybenzoate polyprenyltransferase
MKRAVTLAQVDEFLRIYQIGFVAVWPILGLISADRWSSTAVIALVVIGACFNIFGGVLNDLSDLPSDRQCRGRAERWLVSGAVTERSALLLVLAQIPIILLVHLAPAFETAHWSG